MTVYSKLAYGVVVSVSATVAAYTVYNIISKIQSAKVEDDRLQNSCSGSVSDSQSPVFAQSSQKCVDEDGKGSKNKKMLHKMVPIPLGIIGLVFGKRGRNLRAIEEETQTIMELIKLTDGELRYGAGLNPSNTKLMLPEFEEWEENGNDDREKEEGDDSKMHHFVQIFAHDEKKLRLAELAIQAMIREQAEGRKTIRFVIPNLASGYVIGRGGQNIKKIKDTYTCNIMINQTEGVAEAEVVISGPDEYRIHGAKESIMRSAERCMRMSRDRAELYEKKGEQNEENEENNNKSEWRSGLGLSEDVEKEIAHLRELQLKFEAEPEEAYWLDDTAKSPLEPSLKVSEALPSSSLRSMTDSAQDMDTIDF